MEARGRKIARDTVVRLVGAGAGCCYRPECPTGFLWHVVADEPTVGLAEVAHIVAASAKGPRADPDASEAILTGIDNLLLLCPTCHTLIDKAPDFYTTELIQQWKASHEQRVRDIWEVRTYADKTSARRELVRLLGENREIWATYGPESKHGELVVTDVSAVWRAEVVRRVIPNNAHALRLLEANSHLLNDAELATVTRFRLHADGLTARHLGGVVNPAAPRFPVEVDSLLGE
jgi:hypothetical protein